MSDHDDQRGQPAWRRYLRFMRANPAADLDDELRDHFESLVESLTARGYTNADAQREARRRLGDLTHIRRQVNEMDRSHHVRRARIATLDTVVADVRFAVRQMRRSPAFAITAALSIALGVAANSTIFSVVNAVLLRPIPGSRGAGIVRVYRNHHSPLGWRDLAWFRDNTHSLQHLAGERNASVTFRASPGADVERARISYVTQGYFPALDPRFAIGRPFDVDDRASGQASQIVLTNAFWQRRFAGDSSVVGRVIFIADHPMTIVGVTDASFRSSVVGWSPDAFVPFAATPILTGQRVDDFGGSLYATGQLRPGGDRAAATAELSGLMARLAKVDSAEHDGMTVRLDHDRGVNAELRPVVAIASGFMMLMVALVLAIACANVANLLLGRAAARRTEIGVRLAIGAGRVRVVRQLLTESLLLALLGGAIGFAIAAPLTRLVPAVLPADAGVDASYFSPDWRVVVFTSAICLLTAVLFGTAPAMHATSPDIVGLLKGAPRGARRTRRDKLVAAQSAMCVVLLALAALFLRSTSRMLAVDTGFEASGIVDVDLDLSLAGRGASAQDAFAAIARDAAKLPGVTAATYAAVVPLAGSNMEMRIAPEGMTAARARDYPSTYFNIVGAGYFATLRTRVLRGREFGPDDRAGTPRVAVVNETAARRWWPSQDVVGKRFRFGGPDGALIEIVGLARDAAYVMPGEAPKPTVYLPLAQDDRSSAVLMLRTRSDLASTRRAVWALLHGITPELPPPPVTRMTDDMAITLLPARAGAALLSAFGIVALLLAACGIFGVASYSVLSRTREIGIRASLGATRRQLMRMILTESGKRVGAGAAIGVVLTIGLAALLSKALYGIDAIDPLVLGGVVIAIGSVTILATLGPARRAASVDPAIAIRAE
jgi:predicted permease